MQRAIELKSDGERERKRKGKNNIFVENYFIILLERLAFLHKRSVSFVRSNCKIGAASLIGLRESCTYVCS